MSNAPEQAPGTRRSGEIYSQPLPEDGAKADLKEVRYSLPTMLRELGMEKRSSNFAMEILDQAAIEEIFAAKRKSHG